MAISTEIMRLQGAKASLKTSIENKGVTVPSATKIDGYAALVDQISQGGGQEEAPENDVNFYDYDGFRVASYTIAEAKALTALPTPPTHEGLTFEEWNWTLADIQGYNRRYANIGANYVTTDNKTHLFVTINDTNEVSITFGGYRCTLEIDWGDNSETSSLGYYLDSISKSATHTYQSAGNYEIKVTCVASEASGNYGRGYYGISNHNSIINWTTNLVLNKIWLGTDTSFTFNYSLISLSNKCAVSISKYTNCNFQRGLNYSTIPIIVIPKGTVISNTNPTNYFNGILCCPKSLQYSTLNVQYHTANIIVLPENTNTSENFGRYSAQNILYTRVLSIPSTIKWASTTATDFFSGTYALEVFDIAPGWIPNLSFNLSASSRLSVEGLVAFLTNLGDRSSLGTTLTITLGGTNLAKIPDNIKTAANTKGYTLA